MVEGPYTFEFKIREARLSQTDKHQEIITIDFKDSGSPDSSNSAQGPIADSRKEPAHHMHFRSAGMRRKEGKKVKPLLWIEPSLESPMSDNPDMDLVSPPRKLRRSKTMDQIADDSVGSLCWFLNRRSESHNQLREKNVGRRPDRLKSCSDTKDSENLSSLSQACVNLQNLMIGEGSQSEHGERECSLGEKRLRSPTS